MLTFLFWLHYGVNYVRLFVAVSYKTFLFVYHLKIKNVEGFQQFFSFRSRLLKIITSTFYIFYGIYLLQI